MIDGEIKGLYQLQIFLLKYTNTQNFNKIYQKLKEGTNSPYGHQFHFLFSETKNHVIVSTYDPVEKEEVNTLFLKMGKNGLYIPTQRIQLEGLKLETFDRRFRPGIFDVSDDCASKISDIINEYKKLSKTRLNQYRFIPKLKDRIFELTINRNNKMEEKYSFSA